MIDLSVNKISIFSAIAYNGIKNLKIMKLYCKIVVTFLLGGKKGLAVNEGTKFM